VVEPPRAYYIHPVPDLRVNIRIREGRRKEVN
jgi:hypothetical protein